MVGAKALTSCNLHKRYYIYRMLNKEIFTRQLFLNWVSRILFFVCLSALLPTLPNYLNDIGGNNSQIGIVMSAFAAGVLLFRPLVGWRIDTFGRRGMLLFGIIIFVIMPFFYIYIRSIFPLLLVRVFHGLGLAAFGTASITLITDAAPAKSRNEVISYTGMVNTIAFALGPVSGSFVADLWGYDVLFISVACLAMVCLVISVFIKETKEHHTTHKKINYLEAIKHRRILVSTAMILIVGLVHGGIMFYIPLFLKETVSINIGVFFAVYGIAAFLVRVVVGPFSDKFGRGPMLVVSLISLASGILMLSLSKGVVLMLLSAVLYGIGFGSHQPTLTTLVADNSSERTRGKVFSFYYGGFDLGVSMAGFILGMIAEHFGIKNMFLICCGFTIIAVTIFVTFMESTVSQSLRCALSVQKSGNKCYICDQYQEVVPEQADAYFKTN